MNYNHNIDDIARLLDKPRKDGQGWLCCCPAHEDKNPSLALSGSSNGKLLAYCFAGCSYDSIMSALKSRGLINNPNLKFIPAKPPKATNVQPNQYALSLWNESKLAKDTPVSIYLNSRGYKGKVPETIRYHQKLRHNPSNSFFPAMVAAVTRWPENKVVSIHRTYLDNDKTGKAPITPNKMMLGKVLGGAVRFSAPGTKLVLAEGIETALSVFLATSYSTWATLSTSGMKGIILPPINVTPEIIIAADRDVSGKKAAYALAEQEVSKGRIVRIAFPPYKNDFNDLLRAEQ